jgi:hypothetical protein
MQPERCGMQQTRAFSAVRPSVLLSRLVIRLQAKEFIHHLSTNGASLARPFHLKS